MGLSRFLQSLLGKPQKTDATVLAEEISGYALSEVNEMTVSPNQEDVVTDPIQSSGMLENGSTDEVVIEVKVKEEDVPEEALEPMPSQMAPFMVEMIKGRSYKLCMCGQSKNHPFCDSSHEAKGCKHKPYIFKPKRSGYHSICGCMESYDYPICDGTHDLLL